MRCQCTDAGTAFFIIGQHFFPIATVTFWRELDMSLEKLQNLGTFHVQLTSPHVSHDVLQ